MSKYCPNCGEPAVEGARFCAACGNPLQQEVPFADASQAHPAISNFQPTVQQYAPTQPTYYEPQSVNQPSVAQQPIAPMQSATPIQPVTPANPMDFAYAQPDIYEQQAGVPVQPITDSYSAIEELPKSKPKSHKKLVIALVSIAVAIAVVLSAIFIPELLSDSGDNGYTANNHGNASYNNTDDSADSDTPQIPAKNISRTIMIYIVGSDLESDPLYGGAATTDISEMVNSGLNTSKNNVLLCTGGASDWQNDTVSARKTSFYLVENGNIKELSSTSSKNMGRSSTLSEFLEYGKQNYPADRYGVILWNHGGGPMLGYGHDENYDDFLEIDELADAFADSPFGENSKLEFLGFDACLMGSVETAWVFKDYAEYFIASQEIEPGYGWDYSFLGKLNQCSNGGEIGKVVIDGYFDFYDEVVEQNSRFETDITLSCTKLSKLGQVESCINELFKKVNVEVVAGKISAVSRCRYKTKSFGKYSSNIDYDLIDLKHIASLLASDYKNEAKALENALKDYVVYSRTNVKNANGVSIYHPYDNTSYAKRWVSTFKSLGFASEYAEYIDNFADQLKSGSGSNSNYGGFGRSTGTATQSTEGHKLSMQLTEEQAKTIAGAQYYVFAKLPASETFSKQEEYLHIYTGHNVDISANGTLSATYNGKVVYGKNKKTGETSTYALPMYPVYDGEGAEKYYLPCMFWYFGEALEGFDIQNVNWLMRLKDGNPMLCGAYKMDSDASNNNESSSEEKLFPAKGLLDSEKYGVYSFVNNAYFAKTGKDGTYLEASGSIYGFEYTKEDGFSLEYRQIDDPSQYYAIMVVEDIYGNTYNSDFFCLG